MAFFTKPTGIALLGGVLLSVAVSLWKKENFKQIKWVVLTGLVVAFFILLNSMLSTFGFVEAYQMGEIVYNSHKIKHLDYAKYLMINVPENLFVPDSNLPTIFQFVLLIVGNPIYSLKLFGTKLLYYIFYVRPYYSILHNLLALLVLVPVYLTFMNELFNKELRLPLKSFIIGFVGISILSSTLLTVDWNSRFLVAVLPVIFVLSSRNILYFLNPVSKRIKVKSF